MTDQIERFWVVDGTDGRGTLPGVKEDEGLKDILGVGWMWKMDMAG